LRQVGREYEGWHTRHPSTSKTSLHVDPVAQVWHCFACGAGGDVFDWIGDCLFGEAYDRHRHFREVAERLARGDWPRTSLPAAQVLPDRPPPEWNPLVYLDYHAQVQRAYWYQQLGPAEIIDPAIDYFKLGYCVRHPGWGVPSHTIPILQEGQCVNIRHRLVTEDKKSRYRPHVAGLGAHLFHSDCLAEARRQNHLLILAGEKKAIAAWARGIHEVISTTIGCNWKEEWTPLLEGIDRRYVLFDPGEEERAQHVATLLGARLITLDAKLDDWFIAGHTAQELLRKFRQPVDDYWANRLALPLPPCPIRRRRH
jgi:hypothetical protein